VASSLAIKIARLATRTNIFPLYEIENGTDWTLNLEGDLPVGDYLKIQGRFRHLSETDLGAIQNEVDRNLALIRERVAATRMRNA
jgi:pyruvate/2-oxoacid:ferredoxin oxidoreductase beta subunit